jgi:hypothetical protein
MTKPANSVLRFEAKNAERHGTQIQYETDEVMENIGYWNVKDDYVTWKFKFSASASFFVIVEQACIKGCGGVYAVALGSERLQANVVETGTWQNFSRCRIGRFNITTPGEYILKVEPVKTKGEGIPLMNLRAVFLYPIAEKPVKKNQAKA